MHFRTLDYLQFGVMGR